MSKDQIIACLLFFAGLVACNVKSTSEIGADDVLVISCNAEKWDGDKFVDESGKYKLSRADGRTKEEKRSGEYSLKLTSQRKYGMTVLLHDIKPDDYILVSVWKKGEGHITASDDIQGGFYKATNEIGKTDSLGWEQMVLEFYIPHNYKGEYLKVLLANFGSKPVYFDDLKIVKSNKKVFPSYNDKKVMNIFISDENYKKLSFKRDHAIEEGLLITADDDWVKAIIFYDNQVLDTRIRLKGDRLDHLRGRKWSFRIKIKGDNSWKGMKTFSIQTPAARNYLHEWFFHQALQKEDILCTRYGFVPVIVNGVSLGVYAWEEHFEKQLVEARKRREGPILKLSDDSYWINDKLRAQKKEIDYSVAYYDASVVTPFDTKGITADSVMYSEFQRGRDLYHQYKYAKGWASDIFDIEAVAKYYAMTDASNAYHTLHFFNQRFYYNPVLGKLEPIFFDSFADVGIFDYNGTDLIAEKAKTIWLSVHLKLFADPVFREKYFMYLDKYSKRSFWETIYNEKKEEVNELNNILQEEFTNYNFDINRFYTIAEEARIAKEALQKALAEENLFSKYKDRNSGVNSNQKGKVDAEYLPHLVNVYTQNKKTYRVENYSSDSLWITGFSDIPQLETEKLDKKILLPNSGSKQNYIVDVQHEFSGHKYLFISVRNEQLALPILPWNAPNENPRYLDVMHSFPLEKLKNRDFVEVKSDTLIFKGKVEIDESVVIPKNWIVVFNPGTIINIIKSATFVSYSPVYVNGTQSAPVMVGSSDGSSKGFNVFQAKQKSQVSHAVFSGLGNLNFGGWVTTSAVCFYESDVDFRHVKFEKNIACDDALNVVRSDFLIEDCVFENAFADAFDSDFCTGQIKATKFLFPGNDAIDFSGSMVNIENCTVESAGDKGVSCGEQSTIVIKNSVINGGNIGIASKDKSSVRIEDSSIQNVTYGLVAFCKKPEYGPANISTTKLGIKKYLFLHLIEEGSTLNFNNREIFGQEKKLASKFY